MVSIGDVTQTRPSWMSNSALILTCLVVNVLQQMTEWSPVVVWYLSKALWLSCFATIVVQRSPGSSLSDDTCGILSTIDDLLILVNLLKGARSLKLIPAKSTILLNY